MQTEKSIKYPKIWANYLLNNDIIDSINGIKYQIDNI